MRITLLSLVLVTLVIVQGIAQKLTMDSVMQKVAKGKPYVLTILKPGKPLPSDQGVAKKMHAEHLVYLFQLERDGKICIFGPVTDQKAPVEGIIVFTTADIESARKDLDADPYIRDGYMQYEVFHWFSIPGQTIR